MQARRPKLLDLIAVLKRPPDTDVEIGDVGTVVRTSNSFCRNGHSIGPGQKLP